MKYWIFCGTEKGYPNKVTQKSSTLRQASTPSRKYIPQDICTTRRACPSENYCLVRAKSKIKVTHLVLCVCCLKKNTQNLYRFVPAKN